MGKHPIRARGPKSTPNAEEGTSTRLGEEGDDARRKKGKRNHDKWSTSTCNPKRDRHSGETSASLPGDLFCNNLQMGDEVSFHLNSDEKDLVKGPSEANALAAAVEINLFAVVLCQMTLGDWDKKYKSLAIELDEIYQQVMLQHDAGFQKALDQTAYFFNIPLDEGKFDVQMAFHKGRLMHVRVISENEVSDEDVTEDEVLLHSTDQEEVVEDTPNPSDC
ncbi:hypothetical protein LR48_Vigan03g096300 [Vigna angularis]|uniref:Uncharacterized protein n=1 Tax=Phaseolus angularis TaxID=3914 RepID=A0A0L9U481_PHAAN|nr:hypothetical protein LR48_Vigan03g096300 [Vigna angularis]